MNPKLRKQSQLEVAITESLVSIEEEFGKLPEEVFLNLEELIYNAFGDLIDPAGSLPNVSECVSSNVLFLNNEKVSR